MARAESDDSDEALMERVADGDRQAFTVLFERHHASLVRYSRRFCREPAQAEELTQDVFIKLFRAAPSYRPSARFKTFLFRIATNHCLNQGRQARRWFWSGGDPAERGASWETLADRHLDPAERPDQLLEGRELEGRVDRALAGISPRERAAFSMCRFEGLSYREISQAMRTSESAVKSLIHRATAAVSEALEGGRT